MQEAETGPSVLEKKTSVSFAGFWSMGCLLEITNPSVTPGCSDFDGLCSVNPALMPLNFPSCPPRVHEASDCFGHRQGKLL